MFYTKIHWCYCTFKGTVLQATFFDRYVGNLQSNQRKPTSNTFKSIHELFYMLYIHLVMQQLKSKSFFNKHMPPEIRGEMAHLRNIWLL